MYEEAVKLSPEIQDFKDLRDEFVKGYQMIPSDEEEQTVAVPVPDLRVREAAAERGRRSDGGERRRRAGARLCARGGLTDRRAVVAARPQ